MVYGHLIIEHLPPCAQIEYYRVQRKGEVVAFKVAISRPAGAGTCPGMWLDGVWINYQTMGCDPLQAWELRMVLRRTSPGWQPRGHNNKQLNLFEEVK